MSLNLITENQIHSITKNSKIREKAFFTVIRQSGLKPKTITQLKIKHVEKILEKDTPIPCKIEVPKEIENTKFGGHPSFIAEEAIHHLKNYLRLERRKEKLTEESLLFTIHNKPNKQIDIREINRRLKSKHVQLQDFREYFKQKLQKSKEIGTNDLNYLMGNTNKLPSNFKPEDNKFYQEQYEEIKNSLNIEITSIVYKREAQEKDLHQQQIIINQLNELRAKDTNFLSNILPLIHASDNFDPDDPESTIIGDNLIGLWQKAESIQSETLTEETRLHGWEINPKMPEWIDIPLTLTNLFNYIINLHEDFKNNQKYEDE